MTVQVPRGRTVAVVGESGSGKSTLARAITGLLPPSRGEIYFDGKPLPTALKDRDKDTLRRIQMIYQSADTALNPRQKVRDIIGRPLEFYLGLKGADRDRHVVELLEPIELGESYLDRLPGELSGGQKQRICIARALAAEPELIICDEVTSALDQIVQEEILTLLMRLQKKTNVSYLFITHDIATVRAIADEIVVMYQGKVVQQGPKSQGPVAAASRLYGIAAVVGSGNGSRLADGPARQAFEEGQSQRLISGHDPARHHVVPPGFATRDHAALNAAAAAGEVIGLYILDDETPGQWRWGGASRWWLHHSLQSLSKNLPLVLRRGRADAVIADLIKETGAGAVYFTRDYAPWSPALERAVKDVCESAGVTCHRYGGFLLHEPEAIRNGAGEPYKVFTPFSRACFAAGEPRLPAAAAKPVMWQGNVRSDNLQDWNLLPDIPNWSKGFESEWKPGEAGARARLSRFLDEGLARLCRRPRPAGPVLHLAPVAPSSLGRNQPRAMLAGRAQRHGAGAGQARRCRRKIPEGTSLARIFLSSPPSLAGSCRKPRFVRSFLPSPGAVIRMRCRNGSRA